MEPSTSGTISNNITMSRKELFDILQGSGQKKMEDQFIYLQTHIKEMIGCPERYTKCLQSKIYHFKSDFKSRWMRVGRSKSRFLKKYGNWLDTSISFTSYEPSKLKQRGRPTISFGESTERTKRKKTEDLRKSTSIEVLSYATQMTLRASGHAEASKLVKEATATTPTRASKIRQAYKRSLQFQSNQMSGEDALALLIKAKLSRHQYNLIRLSNPDRFPSYKVIQSEKKKCYPNKEHIKINATTVEVQLQVLLDLTIKRLIVVQKDVIAILSKEELGKLCLVSKWGFDGSSGHSSYKQAFHGSEASDSAVFITFIVPIRLVCDIDSTNPKIIWQNPRPSSTRYCRPLKIAFLKESTKVSVAEKKRVDEEIINLTSSDFTYNDRFISVCHKLIFAMVDGKVCNALTDTSSTQTCYVCGASSRDFNSIDKMISREIKADNLQFGISVLHGWIRFFECLLHLAYKLPIKKWQARGENDKAVVAETKKSIQKQFREKIGLIVDVPKPGFGNSNDGNTARRFFANPEVSAEITKIDVELIKRMHIILTVISCGHSINIDKFREYTHNTARHFVTKYDWYCMPPTVHKIFIHGPDIISSALLPIGQLSEEAQEARNKDFKKFREHYSRKSSREKSNEDIFNLFLLSSDPIITSKRKLPKKKFRYLPREAIDLLVPPPVSECQDDNENENDNDDDEESLHSDSDSDSSF